MDQQRLSGIPIPQFFSRPKAGKKGPADDMPSLPIILQRFDSPGVVKNYRNFSVSSHIKHDMPGYAHQGAEGLSLFQKKGLFFLGL